MSNTKPQLSEELKKKFDEEFVFIGTNNDEGGHYDYESLNTSSPIEIRNFLATALEEQREKLVFDIETMELSGKSVDYKKAQDDVLVILNRKEGKL